MASSGAIRAGRAFVEIGADDKQLRARLKAAEGLVKSFSSRVLAIGASLSGFGAAGIGALVGFAKHFSTAGDVVDKVSARTGLAAETVSGLAFALDQSGASLENLEAGMRGAARTIDDAANGSQTAQDSLAKLGLSAKKLLALSPEQRFEAIADGVSRVADPSLRAAAAMEVLGRSGTALLPLMQNGAAGIRALQQQAQELGLVVSGDTAKSAAALNDAMAAMGMAVKAVGFAIGAARAPIMTDVSKRTGRAAAMVKKLIDRHQELVVLVRQVTVGVTAAGGALIAVAVAGYAASIGIGAMSGALSVATAVAKGAAVVFAALASPLGLATTAVAGLGGAILYYSGAGGKALHWLRERFGELSAFVGDVVGGIRDALSAGDLRLAAQVGLAGVRVAFETAMGPIREVWITVHTKIKEVAVRAWASVQETFHEAVTWMWQRFPDLTAGIATAWTEMLATI